MVVYKKYTTKDGSLSLYSLSYEEGFHDKDGALRESINKYLLPAQLEQFYNSEKIVILDVPLLLENKLNTGKYILVFVDAKKKQIIKRLKLRKNYNNLIFKKLNQLQLSLEKKRKTSNYIIKNDFKKNTVKKRVKIIINKILKKWKKLF